MSLHGDIRVNGRLLMQWEARRVTNVAVTPGPDDVSTYSCRVRFWASDHLALTSDFTVDHRHGDGAAALAALVLSTHATEGEDA